MLQYKQVSFAWMRFLIVREVEINIKLQIKYKYEKFMIVGQSGPRVTISAYSGNVTKVPAGL